MVKSEVSKRSSKPSTNSNGNTNHQPQTYCKKYGLYDYMVPPDFREQYIVKGYRRPNMHPLDCFKSAFVFHCNETFNMWTHFIPLVLFVIKFGTLFATDLSVRDAFTWPLFSYALGICGFCFMSVGAHMFNSVSSKHRNTCFFMDYAAISIYSVGAGQAYFFYSRPLHSNNILMQSPLLFGLISLGISMTSTWLCCTSRLKWHKYKYIIRTGTYAVPFITNSSPFLYRMAICSSAIDCESSAVPAYWRQALFYAISALANVSRFPERYIQDTFDYIGHSHHFLHIFTSLGAAEQLNGVRIDMLARQSALLNDDVQATVWNSLFLMFIGIVGNVFIAYRFGENAGENCSKKK